ncbi:MAG: hypothetical protein KDA85_18905, partial [Planctomycetaceae bacterium]|nr:hypothetical protein [Planctomycetaceae bacterium]
LNGINNSEDFWSIHVRSFNCAEVSIKKSGNKSHFSQLATKNCQKPEFATVPMKTPAAASCRQLQSSPKTVFGKWRKTQILPISGSSNAECNLPCLACPAHRV